MTSVLFRYIAKSENWIDTLSSEPTFYLKITSAKDLSNYLVSQPDNNETMIRHFLCSQLPSRIIRSQTFLIILANLGDLWRQTNKWRYWQPQKTHENKERKWWRFLVPVSVKVDIFNITKWRYWINWKFYKCCEASHWVLFHHAKLQRP